VSRFEAISRGEIRVCFVCGSASDENPDLRYIPVGPFRKFRNHPLGPMLYACQVCYEDLTGLMIVTEAGR